MFSTQGYHISIVFGLCMLALALWVDLRVRHQAQAFVFWLYIFGALTFWGGLSSLDSRSELSRLLNAALNVGLIGLGAAF